MPIANVLDLNRKLIREEEALAILEEVWEEQGRPEARDGLLRVLKTTLDRCQLRNVAYPRIFLRRKGELARNEFSPRSETILPRVRYSGGSHPTIPQGWIHS